MSLADVFMRLTVLFFALAAAGIVMKRGSRNAFLLLPRAFPNGPSPIFTVA